jgi:hypothetical protein
MLFNNGLNLDANSFRILAEISSGPMALLLTQQIPTQRDLRSRKSSGATLKI